MKNNYETIIIGAGVIGSSIAYQLSKKSNERILLIDKGYPLSGTSGATQAWVWVHSKEPNYYGELSLRSAELYKNLNKEIGEIDYIRSGGISPIFTQEEFEKAKTLQYKQLEVGIEVEILTKEEVLEKEPLLSKKILGATYSRIDGNVNPFKLMRSYIEKNKEQNVEFSFYNKVLEIERKQDIFYIHTEKGKYIAKKLVIAAGAWSKEVGKLLKVDVPITQVRGQVLVTEPLPPILEHTVVGFRQLNNGIVLIGYSKENVGFDRGGTLDVIQETAGFAINTIPALRRANIVRCFSGIRVIPKDGLPIFGEIAPNLYIAVMHSGITLSPIIGKEMAELIINGETEIAMNQYSISRF